MTEIKTWIVIILTAILLAAFGIISEMDYQDEIELQSVEIPQPEIFE